MRDTDAARRHERWSFDDPAPPATQKSIAPKAREELSAPKAREDSSPPKPLKESLAPQLRDDLPQNAPPPRPSNPAASPWRKIQIPDAERQRAALAGLHRYVGKAGVKETGPQAPLPVGARFGAPRGMPAAPAASPETPAAWPEPAHQAADDEVLAHSAPARASSARRPEPARTPPPSVPGNPRLGLTVSAIVAVFLVAAVGLSWIATPALDGPAVRRADILQRMTPPAQTAEQPTVLSPQPIEVAPSSRSPQAAAAGVQPIEVAP